RRALHVVALAETESAHLRGGHVRVVASREVSRRAEEAVTLVTEIEETFDLDELAGVVLGPVDPPFRTAAFAGTIAVPSAAAAPALVAAAVVVAPLRLTL